MYNRTTDITDKNNETHNNQPKHEHLHAEVESLRSMLHRWFGIKKTETGEDADETPGSGQETEES